MTEEKREFLRVRADFGLKYKIEDSQPLPHVTISTLARVLYVLDNYWDEYLPYGCGVEFLELKKKDRKRVEQRTKDLRNLYEELQVTYLCTVKALAQAIDARDHYTHSHLVKARAT